MIIISEHQFVVEVVREPGGELLAQESLDELGFLADEARYLAVSGGRFPDDPSQLTARLVPVSDEARPGLTGGVRAQLTQAGSASGD